MDYKKYYWLNEESRTFLSRGYISETPEQRIKDIANKAEKYLRIEGFAKKFEDYMSRGFYSLSTPVWINFGKDKGLPISCYGSNVDDTLDSILNAGREMQIAVEFAINFASNSVGKKGAQSSYPTNLKINWHSKLETKVKKIRSCELKIYKDNSIPVQAYNPFVFKLF